MKKISLSTPSVKSTQIFKDSCCSSYCTKYDCLMSITGCVLFYVLWMSFSQKPRQVPLTRAVNVWCFVLRHILRAFWEIVKTEVVSRKKQTNLVINTRTCIRFTSITHQTNLVSAQHSYQTYLDDSALPPFPILGVHCNWRSSGSLLNPIHHLSAFLSFCLSVLATS